MDSVNAFEERRDRSDDLVQLLARGFEGHADLAAPANLPGERRSPAGTRGGDESLGRPAPWVNDRKIFGG